MYGALNWNEPIISRNFSRGVRRREGRESSCWSGRALRRDPRQSPRAAGEFKASAEQRGGRRPSHKSSSLGVVVGSVRRERPRSNWRPSRRVSALPVSSEVVQGSWRLTSRLPVDPAGIRLIRPSVVCGSRFIHNERRTGSQPGPNKAGG